ncbi:hypothetical protein NFI96_015362 [Prochilodus magdalenae]|nr:hypothetical protein NFI96_015362 [Prochilodus magdalenae]
MTIDVRRHPSPLIPLTASNSPVSTVDKCLGTIISPKWETNIKSILKKAQQRMSILRLLRKLVVPRDLLIQLYTAVIKSVQVKRGASPEDSWVAMKSDQSIPDPPDFTSGTVSSDPEKAVSSSEGSLGCSPGFAAGVRFTASVLWTTGHRFGSSRLSTGARTKRGLSADYRMEALQISTEPALQINTLVEGTGDLHQDSHQPVDDVLHRVLQRHRTSMKNKYESLFEGIKTHENKTLLNRIYTQLYIIEGKSEGVNEEHEVLQMERTPRRHLQDTPINCLDIFKPLQGSKPDPEGENTRTETAEGERQKSGEELKGQKIRSVLTKGIAGIGKTVSVQKFILDWAEGKANQDVELMFVLPFRELNLIKDDPYSLHGLLCDFHPELKDMDPKIHDQIKAVFIFDGLDESRIPLDFEECEKVSDITMTSSVGVLMTNLIKGELLPSALIWITSRPAAANQISPKHINRVTEIQGFSDPQKEEYFRKRISDEDQAERIIFHIKTVRSLHIMCHIPVFCWISATVLQQIMKQGSTEIPRTLTEMYSHFLLTQTNMKNEKYEENDERDPKNLLESNRTSLLKLAELAFKQLMMGNVMFYEEDLRESSIDVNDAALYSGIFTEIFREECGLHQKKVYCFVHLSFQEFLAAVYVFHCYQIRNMKDLQILIPQYREWSEDDLLDELLMAAVDKAVESQKGHLDLFLRFLLGISLESNQRLLQGLLTPTQSRSERIIEYIKKLMKKTDDDYTDTDEDDDDDDDDDDEDDDDNDADGTDAVYTDDEDEEEDDNDDNAAAAAAADDDVRYQISTERSINLFLCLSEMNDQSLSKEIQKFLHSEKHSEKKLSPGECSALAYMLLTSEKEVDELDLKKYTSSEEGYRRLIPAVTVCRKAQLAGCSLTLDSFEIIYSALKSVNCPLKELDLSNNDLQDTGVELISVGLKSLNCKLEILRVGHGGEIRMKPGPRKYAVDLTLDPNTVHRNLSLSEGNRKVEWVKEDQLYPDHPDRFDEYLQALSVESLTGRCYWEAEYSWEWGGVISVSYRDIRKKGLDTDCLFGNNTQSWSLQHSNDSYTVTHNNQETVLHYPSCASTRIGVYLDWESGTLSFYTISPNTYKPTHLHTFKTMFTEPLYAGVRVFSGHVKEMLKNSTKQTGTNFQYSQTDSIWPSSFAHFQLLQLSPHLVRCHLLIVIFVTAALKPRPVEVFLTQGAGIDSSRTVILALISSPGVQYCNNLTNSAFTNKIRNLIWPNSPKSALQINTLVEGTGDLHQDSHQPLNDVLHRVLQKHRTSMKNKYESLFEGTKTQENKTLLSTIYTQLYIIQGESEGVNEEHEVLQMERTPRRHIQDTSINCLDIFKPLQGSKPDPEEENTRTVTAEGERQKSGEELKDQKIRSVLTKGIAGIGKTVSVQKFILDWAEGKTNQDAEFMLVLPFRELNLIKDDPYSLHGLLCDFHPELKDLDPKIYDQIKAVFIFDGLDESRIPLDFEECEEVSDITMTSSVSVLMTNLIKGELLPSALIWITSRPAAANQIPPKYINRVTEIQGFSDPQKEEYFRKRVSDEDQAERIISHIKTVRSLHIMCHIPVFCWISATVLQQIMKQGSTEIPRTLTEMYSHFLLTQTKMKNEKYEEKDKRDPENLLESNRTILLKLAELAFKQLMKGNVMFYEEDLRESRIDVTDTPVYSGIFTEIFREECVHYQRKVYCFVHLSFQEFLAAVYVFHCYQIRNMKNLQTLNPWYREWSEDDLLDELLMGAVYKALLSQNGHLDLFIRFLLGISLESNQRLLQGLLTPSRSSSITKIKNYIKSLISAEDIKYRNISTDRSLMLFLCLSEMNDQSLSRELQEFLKSERQSRKKLSPGQCSALACMLLTSEEVLDELDLKKYSTSVEGYRRLIPAVTVCRKAQLADCNLTWFSCYSICSALQSANSSLKELDLSNNDLTNSGLKLLSAGLNSSECKLEMLRLAGCHLTRDSCVTLCSALQSPNSTLKKLDLSYNDLQDSGVELLSVGLTRSHCKLENLRLAGCNLTQNSCDILCSALQSANSFLKELDLCNNNLKKSRVELLSAGLKWSDCKLETLRLAGCHLTKDSCGILCSAVQPPNSTLKEIDLSYNDLEDSGVELFSVELNKSHCKLEKLRLAGCNLTHKSYNTLCSTLQSANCSLKELDLSNNDLKDLGVEQVSAGLKCSDWKLETLRLASCNLTEVFCGSLCAALKSPNSNLRDLDLSNNDLQDSGVKRLFVGLEISHCKLEKLRLSGCMVTIEGCSLLASALNLNLLHLRELDLSYNHPGESGVKLLSDLMEDPHCTLEKIRVDHGGEIRMKPGLKKWAVERSRGIRTNDSLADLVFWSRSVTAMRPVLFSAPDEVRLEEKERDSTLTEPLSTRVKRGASPEHSCVGMKSDRTMGKPPELSTGGGGEPSCVSMKSDRSIPEPPVFSRGGGEPSCVSMKSDRSLPDPPVFSRGGGEPSCVSIKSDRSIPDPPLFSRGGGEPSCVSMKSDRSIPDPPLFSRGGGEPSCVSMKSDRSIPDPPLFSRGGGEPSCVSMKSDRPMPDPPSFSRGGEEPSCVSIKSDRSIPDPPLFSRGGGEPSCVSMKSDRSLPDPPSFSRGGGEPSCVSVKAVWQNSTEPALQINTLVEGTGDLHQDSHQPVDDVLHRVLQRHRTSMKNKYESLFEGIKTQENKTLLSTIYTQLYIIEGESEGVNEEHEVLQMERTPRRHLQGTPINCLDIFKPLQGSKPDPEEQNTRTETAEGERQKSGEELKGQKVRSVLTKGIAGIGKTVSVQKFILDWAEGKANQDVELMIVLPFRELNLIRDDPYSLHGLLCDFHPEIKDLDPKIHDQIKAVFIFDGLDESRIPLDFKQCEKVSDITMTSSVGVLMTNLIKGELLPSALIWITSRPAAANQIPPKYINRVTEIQGFSDPQKEEYFRKRISDEDQAKRIISHIKTVRSLHIMCHIPVFCWISATVLQQIMKQSSTEIPRTLTEMYSHFLLTQTNMKNEKYEEKDKRDPKNLLESNRTSLLKLAELAFKQLMKGNVMFYEEDLKESRIDVPDASVYSGIFTEIFREECGLYQRKVYCFVHLSFQEFLAAVYVFHCYQIRNMEDLQILNPRCREWSEDELLDKLLMGAVYKAVKGQKGHLDLFLRFLLGISLESNQRFLQGLLTHTQSRSERIIEYIKRFIRGEVILFYNMSTESSINLFLCLSEMKDQSLSKEIQKFLHSETHLEKKLSPGQCSALAYILLTSEEEEDELDLKKYNTSEEGYRRLVPAVSVCRKVRLTGCNLTRASWNIIFSALQSPNSFLKEIDLSNKDLHYSGVHLLSAGLKSSHCKLETLRLSGCNLTKDSYNTLCSALQSPNASLIELDLSYNDLQNSELEMLSLKSSHCKLEKLRLAGCYIGKKACENLRSALQSANLKELDLSNNDLQDSGVELLSVGLQNSHGKLEKLRLAACNIGGKACENLASALQSANSSLKELDLSNNDLQDSGVELLSAGLKILHCKLETLRLSCCMVSNGGCSSLASALQTNPSHLRELDLSYNHPGEFGMKLLLGLQEDPHCSLEKLRYVCERTWEVDHGGEIRMKPGPRKYAVDLTLDPNTVNRRLSLSEGNRKVGRVGEDQRYPDHPDRFESYQQVLSVESLTGPCYWEIQWSGMGADISVSYRGIRRKGRSVD